jgi:peptidase C25-like protein
MTRQKLFLISILLVSSIIGYSIPYEIHIDINWSGMQKYNNGYEETERLFFDDAHYVNGLGLPHYVTKFPIHSSSVEISVNVSNGKYLPLNNKEAEIIRLYGITDTQISIQADVLSSRNEPVVQIDLLPFRWNSIENQFEKLIECDLEIEIIDIIETDRQLLDYTETSVLSEGDWYKVKLNEDGIYKITYDELVTMGFDVSVNPSKIAVFGNGGGILPEKNDEFRYDDLYENPIVVVGEQDGSFDNGDYILFYGQGPVVWKYNPIRRSYYHQTNYYEDHSYYFVTALLGDGKRIQSQESIIGDPDIEVSEFTDYAVHEIDERNIAGIGRTWYGEIYDYTTEYEFIFEFPNISKTENSGYFKGNFASKAYSSNAFKIYINGNLEKIESLPTLSLGNRYEFAKSAVSEFDFTPDSDQLIVKTEFIRSSNTSVGYLNFFEINVQRSLNFSGDQMIFRKHFDSGEIARYKLKNAGQNITIWDISTPVNPYKVNADLDGDVLTFKSIATIESEYIAFNGNSYLSVEFVNEVPNQNLHGYRNLDYVIIVYPEFLEEAERLANFHRSKGNLDVLVATIDQVYNEFSSGGQDISAIRDFAKMLYDDSDSGRELKYLLLFGDASYDYKDILTDNTNFVPCWESVSSLDILSSIASDDYFGFMDNGEGVEGQKDLVDIGIGRFVTATTEEAKAAVDKTIHYSVNTFKVMAPWRNVVTFLADDGDNGRHMKDAEKLATMFDTSFQVYNVSKIYADAYEQISTPSGQAAPDVNRAINERIEKGTLIFNYSGHGGEIGLGHERFLQVPDIQSWRNYDKLSVFITATCEFTRYDDPKRVSAGELVFLNDKGGAITLFTTSRPTYAGSNLALNRAIYNDNLFKKIDGEYPTFGDVIRRSKLYGTANDKKFVLIGDPACKMAYPEYDCETTQVKTILSGQENFDTIKALQLVKVKGIVTDNDGIIKSDFNGELFSSVYDKKTEIQTIGDENPQFTFYVRNSIIFNGKATIINGEFEFEFMVPKDIAYKYGDGRISYYFRDTVTDGNGYFEDVVIGGFNENAVEDTEGPVIELFMNDSTFVSGGITNQNPNLLAFVSDSSGINTTGNGIGHDIITVIDEDKQLTFVLNDYYEAAHNRYNQGAIVYPFSDLEEGEHTLSLKVWDVYNNSSTASIDFVVVESANVIVKNLMNYPNPFINETNFVFDHNQSGNIIDVQLEIFRIDGQLVKTIRTTLEPEGHQSEPITWNGETNGGDFIGNGFYVYRVTVRNEDGGLARDSSKLVYVR